MIYSTSAGSMFNGGRDQLNNSRGSILNQSKVEKKNGVKMVMKVKERHSAGATAAGEGSKLMNNFMIQ